MHILSRAYAEAAKDTVEGHACTAGRGLEVAASCLEAEAVWVLVMKTVSIESPAHLDLLCRRAEDGRHGMHMETDAHSKATGQS